MNASPRIKRQYKPGSGDSGFSMLMDGEMIRKDDPSCWIYSEIEWLNNLISETLITFQLNNELKELLTWLKNNSFSLSSFCFMKGNTDRHSLPKQKSDEIQDLVEFKKRLWFAESNDFVINTKLKYVKLDGIRIKVRDVERAFTAWRNHNIVLQNVMKVSRTDPQLAQNILLEIDAWGGFLNRLSTLIWLMTRHEAVISDEYQSQEYWQGMIDR